jgi:twinkle protein
VEADRHTTRPAGSGVTSLLSGEAVDLPSRHLSKATCSKWAYLVSQDDKGPCHVANYRDASGAIVAQKIRRPGKAFMWRGDPSKALLFGQHLWRDKGRMIIITEGELDALSVSQLQENKWPVVSVPNGAQAAAKDLAKHLEWLSGFDTIVLMFDNDTPGKKAAQECARLLPPGKAAIASLPLKDASEMLMSGRGAEVIGAAWGAKAYRPDGLVSAENLLEAASEPPKPGLGFPWPTLTEYTMGFRPRELYVSGGAVGGGKTDIMTQIAAHIITAHKRPVGLIYLEQGPPETLRRVAGKAFKKTFHIPGSGWEPKEIQEALASVAPLVWLYDHFGSTDWAYIQGLVRYMRHALGIREVFIDHLTALVSHADDERRALDALMDDMSTLAHELEITIFAVSHLATPEGKAHEEGGRVEARHFRGSRAIMQWAHFMFGFERNQQAADETIRRTTTIRVLKDRYTGRSTGKTLELLYNPDTGILEETQMRFPFDTTADDKPSGELGETTKRHEDKNEQRKPRDNAV